MRRLSMIVPVHFTSAYRRSHDGGPFEPEFASWWQWRGRIWRHKTIAI